MINLLLKSSDNTSTGISFECKQMYNAAFAGRDAADVQYHIDEMAALGIAPPVKFPLADSVSNHLLSTTDSLQIYLDGEKNKDTTSGEVEYVLIWYDGDILIGVGLDHCDLYLERYDLQRSKNVAPNIIASDVWLYSEVATHFDELVLQCDAWIDEQWETVQKAKCATLLAPEKWISIVKSKYTQPDGTVFFSGTICSLDGVKHGSKYRFSLIDPILKREIHHEYKCTYVKTLL